MAESTSQIWSESQRAKEMSSFLVMDLVRAASERERSGKTVYHMEAGQPSQGAPKNASKVVQEALQRGDLMGYTESHGLFDVRQRILKHYREEYGVTHLTPDQVFITMGSSAAFTVAFASAFNPGDKVALASPGYPCYRNVLKMLGCEEVSIPVDDSTNFQPTVQLIKEAEERAGGRLHGLIIASPSNPTGTMLDPEGLKELANYCSDAKIRFISDEIYHGVVYGTRAMATCTQYSDSCLVINSFSKYYRMTGWRVGWIVVPKDLVTAASKVQQNAFINAPTMSQLAAGASFDDKEELNATVQTYKNNRDVLLKGLPEAGLHKLASSDGAFYIYADVSDFTNNSLEFSMKILDETGVACTPGVDFDQVRGHRFLRFSFSRSTEEISAGMKALKEWLAIQPRLTK